MKKTLEVVGALIENEKKEILCMLRAREKAFGNMWEFPGGKIEKNETIHEAIARELKEELDIDLLKSEKYQEVKKEYEKIIINLTILRCEIDLKREIRVKEHEGMVWLKKENLESLVWVPTDIPVVKKLLGEKNETI